MATGRLDKAQEVFDLALAAPEDQRPSVLAEVCAGDDDLRKEVESLLEHNSRADIEFLRPPEPAAGLDLTTKNTKDMKEEAPDPLIGRRIGQYRIERVIAAGGMGTVYLARQQHPERDVALKVMKAGISSPAAMKRFEHEAQVLAKLRHPNIAHVYDAGTHREGGGHERTVLYFAMEYIPEARLITEFARDLALPTRRRLELFEKVCDAVHHGHQKGVIQRDLKPGNILVDASGEPKIIDFGVARSTDSDVAVTTMRTDVGQIIGTLQYMSPEQCDADPHNIDTRSDVYSLGIVLYELLCGQLPYDVSRVPIYEATRVIRQEAPTRLCAVNRKLRGDVETVVLKALDKNREKRYQSAAEMARDIRRYLNREPVEAKPPTPWTRALRWIIRHPVATSVIVSLSVGACIILGAIITTWYVTLRPARVVLSPDRSRASLVSLAGKELVHWKGPVESIAFAELVERPAELGGGQCAVIGFGSEYPDPILRGTLCCFNLASKPDRPVWSRRVVAADVLPVLREMGPRREVFSLRATWLFDVLEEHPGNELVASFGSEFSQRVVRIYGLEGELLYQFWHDGSFHGCQWMPGPRLLVFAGPHWAYWKEPASPNTDRIPRVVFAVRPEHGMIYNEFLQCGPSDDPRVPSPVWYKLLLLPGVTDFLPSLRLKSPDSIDDREMLAVLDCSFRVGDDFPTVSWHLDQTGTLLQPPTCTDQYLLILAKLPDPKKIRLVNLAELEAELDVISPRQNWPVEWQTLCPPPQNMKQN